MFSNICGWNDMMPVICSMKKSSGRFGWEHKWHKDVLKSISALIGGRYFGFILVYSCACLKFPVTKSKTKQNCYRLIKTVISNVSWNLESQGLTSKLQVLIAIRLHITEVTPHSTLSSGSSNTVCKDSGWLAQQTLGRLTRNEIQFGWVKGAQREN